jgi:integrase
MARDPTGQIVERGGKDGTAFAARFRAYGARQYVTLGHSQDGYTRRHAETELQNILADVRRGIWRPPSSKPEVEPTADPGFHEFASAWIAGRQDEVAARTVEDYRWALSHHLLPFFRKHGLSAITIAEIDRYRASKVRERERCLVSRPLSNRSINSTLSVLAQVLEVAVDYGHITSNPARGRRRRLKEQVPRRSWLEPEQVAPLLDATVRGLRGGHTTPDARTRALFATAIGTGLRVGELLALRWRDVELARGRVVVIHSKTEAGSGRVVDLWPEVADELASYKAQAQTVAPADLVFGTATGKPDTRTNVAKRLKRAVARANERLAADEQPLIPEQLSPHSLRRTFASLLYCRGENPVYVMQQMGHTDPKLALRIYTKVMGEQRNRGPGARLTAILAGARWIHTGTLADEIDARASEPPTTSQTAFTNHSPS